MKAVLFGATGMIGRGVLRECLRDPEVSEVLSIVRRPSGVRDPKLREIAHSDFADFSGLERDRTGFDACFFCLGVSSAGMNEADYRRVTYDYAIAAATVLAERNPGMTFVFISGKGTDATEKGRVMWARVKGATENALRRFPFRAVYAFRPAYIQPLHGIRSGTKWTRVFYAVMAPLYPLWKALFPPLVTTTEELARAMIHVAAHGYEKPIIESGDIGAVLGTA
jgi:uncharacterized protein YbjT (DUF2867 family)